MDNTDKIKKLAELKRNNPEEFNRLVKENMEKNEAFGKMMNSIPLEREELKNSFKKSVKSSQHLLILQHIVDLHLCIQKNHRTLAKTTICCRISSLGENIRSRRKYLEIT